MVDIIVYDSKEQDIKTIKARTIIFNWDNLTFEAYDQDDEIIYKGKVDCISLIEEDKDNDIQKSTV